jgi:hypothetical protein
MTQRSIQAGQTPTVIVRAGADVRIEGWDDDRVLADTESRWGLKVERRSESEIGRVRARVGERTLFDVPIDVAGLTKKNVRAEVTEVEIGGSGQVRVPLGSRVKVYAGKSVEVRSIQGSVAVYAGRDVRVGDVHTLAHVSAGGAVDLECETVEGDDVKIEAGRDVRCHIRGLADARFMINDLGDYWEGVVGDGRVKIRLKAGGDVTLVTDREVVAQPPHYILGNIQRPDDASGQDEQAGALPA